MAARTPRTLTGGPFALQLLLEGAAGPALSRARALAVWTPGRQAEGLRMHLTGSWRRRARRGDATCCCSKALRRGEPRTTGPRKRGAGRRREAHEHTREEQRRAACPRGDRVCSVRWREGDWTSRAGRDAVTTGSHGVCQQRHHPEAQSSRLRGGLRGGVRGGLRGGVRGGLRSVAGRGVHRHQPGSP